MAKAVRVALKVVDGPRTRGDCASVPRPCPHAACVHHLGEGKRAPETLPPDRSCALDVADEGPHQMGEVGAALGISKQRVEQIERAVFRKISRMPGAIDMLGGGEKQACGALSDYQRTEGPADPDADPQQRFVERKRTRFLEGEAQDDCDNVWDIYERRARIRQAIAEGRILVVKDRTVTGRLRRALVTMAARGGEISLEDLESMVRRPGGGPILLHAMVVAGAVRKTPNGFELVPEWWEGEPISVLRRASLSASIGDE